MIRRTLALATIGLALFPAPARAASRPFLQDPMGPIRNVTADWQHYQAADTFCIKPDVTEYAQGGVGVTTTGTDPACATSGFAPTDTGLVKIHVQAPELCATCVRLFIDFSQIPPTNALGDGRARGHVYYHLDSINNTYKVDPTAHGPNTKDFYDDKLVTPDGSPQQPVVGAFESYAIDYVTDTKSFVHTASQGPYYIGPWYLNREGQRIEGVYLDVDLANAAQWPNPTMNGIGYIAGFNSGGFFCPSDDDAYYAGCIDWFGGSSTTVDPFND